MNIKETITTGEGEEAEKEERTMPKVAMGKVPIMLRSSYCLLSKYHNLNVARISGECPHDQGGYFIINGSEKVIIAQERMANNQVYVFTRTHPRYSHTAEIKSAMDTGMRPGTTVMVRMLTHSAKRTSDISGKQIDGRTIECTLPYIRKPIPIVLVFRGDHLFPSHIFHFFRFFLSFSPALALLWFSALGIVADGDILQYICYDLEDQEMLELLRPSFVEANDVQNQEIALDYIGKRGNAVGSSYDKRIRHGSDILQKEMLPHVGIRTDCGKKKAFFFGYLVSGLLLFNKQQANKSDSPPPPPM